MTAQAACDRPSSQLGARSRLENSEAVSQAGRPEPPSPAQTCASQREGRSGRSGRELLRERHVWHRVPSVVLLTAARLHAAVGKERKGGDPTMACRHVKRGRSHQKRESRCAQRRSMQTHVLSDRSRYFSTEFFRMAGTPERTESPTWPAGGFRDDGRECFLHLSSFTRPDFALVACSILFPHFGAGEREFSPTLSTL